MALDYDRVPVGGTWWHQSRAGLDPLARRDPPADGRWQRGEVVEAFYAAESEETAWAEWYRRLAEAAIPPACDLPRELWRLAVNLGDVADLSTVERLAAVDLRPPVPGRVDWPAFQDVGESIQADGRAGLIALSAARLDGVVLCVFRTEDALPGVRPKGRPRLVAEPPVPPRGLRT